MASEKVNFIEEHVEKIALGACGVFLIFAIFSWVFTSSRTVEGPGGSIVSPDAIDPAILKEAKRIKTSIDKNDPPKKPVPNFVDAIKAQQNKKTSEYAQINANLEIQAPLPTPILMQMPGQADYKQVVAAVINPGKPVAIATYKVPRVDPPQELASCDVVVSYPIGMLKGAWQKVFSTSMMQEIPVIIYRVETQVRDVLDDGSTSEPRPLGPVLTTAPAGGLPSAIPELEQWNGSIEKAEPVRQAIKDWKDKWQGLTIQPGFWDVYVQEGGSKKWVSWKEYIQTRLNALPGLPAGIKRVIDSTVFDSMDKQMVLGDVLIWRHDQNIERQKKLSYRFRLTFLNPGYATNDVFGSAEDAKKLTISTEWSEWSDPAGASKGATSTFKITGANPVGELVKVRIETEYLNQNLTLDMEVAAGQAISKTVVRSDVVDPITNKKLSAPVAFDTGAIMVKTEKIKVPSVADLTSISRDAMEVIYLDEAGKLKMKVFRSK